MVVIEIQINYNIYYLFVRRKDEINLFSLSDEDPM